MKGSHIMTTIQDIADKMNISKSTVSKALNDAPDISETLRKQVLETAVALGYTKLRRYKKPVKICIITEKENIQYEEPHHFAYDILLGFAKWLNQPVLILKSYLWTFRCNGTNVTMFLCWSMIT